MKKAVFKLEEYDVKRTMKVLGRLDVNGIESLSINRENRELTVIGDIDPIKLVTALRKCFPAEILSVAPAKEREMKKEDGENDEIKEFEYESIPQIQAKPDLIKTTEEEKIAYKVLHPKSFEKLSESISQVQAALDLIKKIEERNIAYNAPHPKSSEISPESCSPDLIKKSETKIAGRVLHPPKSSEKSSETISQLQAALDLIKKSNLSERIMSLITRSNITDNRSSTSLIGSSGWPPISIKLNDLKSLRPFHKPEVSIKSSYASSENIMEVQLDFQESYYNLFDIEELLGLLNKDLEYNVLESKHVLVRNLKVMDIWVSKLSEIPNNLSFPDLEKLFLYTNSDSKNIPDSFFKGRPVVHYSNLDLSYIPPSFFERMPSLKELNLTNSRMKTLPPSVLKLINLEKLISKGCAQLIEIPHNISVLENLRALDLTGCTNLVEIPEAIESLKRLTSLDLTDCESLTKLPESISEIPFLHIKLSGCSSLFEFHGPQVSVKCLSWNISEPNRKQVELDFHETQGTPSDITEILGLMEKVLQHQLLKSEELEVAVIKLKVIHISKSKVPEIPKQLCFPDLEMLVLQPDIDLISSITSSFFERLPTFKVLDMSHTHIKTLPSCVYELTDLKGLILQRCELLTELPDGIGALENLELLDLEGTDLVCLPEELKELIELKCLKFSLYDAESYRKNKDIVAIIPRKTLSKLTQLEELSINVDPQEVWCGAAMEAVMEDLPSLRKLKLLKLYLPTTKLLQDLLELKGENGLPIYQNLSDFTFVIGPHAQHFISRLPCDLEEEFLKLKKCLKYINGEDSTPKLGEALKHANALYLDRHWTLQKLSVFKFEDLIELKFCLLVDCNEMQTLFDGSDFNLGIVNNEDKLLSLQYLAIHYLRKLEVIWKGPGVGCCLHSLKVLVVHTCPNLTTIFTPVLLEYLVNLREIEVEDCPKIKTLVAEDQSHLKSKEILPRLKKLSLLYLPELVSMFDGLSIGPELENIVIYDCPKLERLPSVGVCNKEVIEVKGEGEWWNALEWSESEWSGGRPYCLRAFSESDTDEDMQDELAPRYGNTLCRLVEDCNST